MLSITPKARFYALRELARRAGVKPSFFAEWRVQLEDERTRVWIGESKSVDFPNAAEDFWREINNGEFHVEHAHWPYAPAARVLRQVPEFIVPFASREIRGPLFRIFDEHRADCPVDLLSSIWLTLSRFEETLPGERDIHGRFTAAQSLASKRGFLQRPIVDEYGFAFEQVLLALVPGWEPRERELQVKLSHDIDHVGLPFQFRATAGHLLTRQNADAAFRDALSPFTNILPAHLQCVLEIVNVAKEHGLESAVYWKSSRPGPFDSGYDLNDAKVQRAIGQLRDAGTELGVHPSYDTFHKPGQLLAEVESMRDALGERELGGRQHYLRWSPLTWQHWESCGLKYDSSVGFADHIGFRAGTCFPYRPWLLDLNREADLLEIPLLVMEGTFPVYMKLGREESLEAACACIARCKTVGGVFTFLFHNHALLDSDLRWLYEQLLQRLRGVRNYDWRAELQELCPTLPFPASELTTSVS